MAALGDLYYLAREGEDGELNARTPSRSDLFTTKTVPIGDGRELVASERAVSAAAHHQALLDRCGLTFLSSGTTAPLEALRDPERVMSTAYFQETEQMLLDHLPDVGYAFAFNFVNRQSDLLVHTLPASDKSARGPVNDVHSDFTAESFVIKGIEQRQEQLGLSGARCMIVNIWRPLCAPGESVSSWPLTVCDASSVPVEDIAERESPENASIIQNAFHSPSHRWYYLPAMTSSEAIVFKTYESDTTTPGLSQFALHCSFDEAARRAADAPQAVRESIEVRVACFVCDEDSARAAHEGAGIGSVRATAPKL